MVIRYVRRVPVTYAPEQAQLFEDGSDHLTVPVRLKGIRVERSRQFGDVYPCLNTCRGKQPSKVTASKARELLGILLDRLERPPERRHAPSERAPTGFTSAGDREAFNAVLADAERKGAIVVVKGRGEARHEYSKNAYIPVDEAALTAFFAPPRP